MTRTTCFSMMAAVTTAGVFLTPDFANTAQAQISISIPGLTNTHYNGYSTYYRPNARYYTYTDGRTYSGYGNGPYGYSPSIPSGNLSYYLGTGSRGGYNSTYYRGTSLRSGIYRPSYIPNSTRYYMPYGYGYRLY